jgi:DNA-binding NarL/FixJ family response regulator
VRVVLVDDHEVMREGLASLLGRRGIETIGTAATVADAEETFRTLVPDVAVIDVKLPDGSGLQLVRKLRAERPEVGILVYTGAEEVGVLADALESGAQGFVLKLGGISQLVEALHKVARGERYVDPAIRVLIDAQVDGKPLLLTKREREVFDLLAQGLTGEEIATRLEIGAETVRTHIRNAMDKLDSHTRTGAVVEALNKHEIGAEAIHGYVAAVDGRSWSNGRRDT